MSNIFKVIITNYSFRLKFILFLNFVIFAALINYYVLKNNYDNAMNYGKKLQYTETENLAFQISEQIDKTLQNKDKVSPDFIFVENAKKNLTQKKGRKIALTRLLLSLKKRASENEFLLNISGEIFIVDNEKSKNTFFLYKTNLSDHLQLAKKTRGIHYLLDPQGSLLFSNTKYINQKNFITRNIVQNFISSPLNQIQLSYNDLKGRSMIGGYQVVPGKNLFLFMETEEKLFLSSFYELLKIHAGISLLFILLFTLVINIAVDSLRNQIKALDIHLGMLNKGYFVPQHYNISVKELRPIKESINSLATKLGKLSGTQITQQHQSKNNDETTNERGSNNENL